MKIIITSWLFLIFVPILLSAQEDLPNGQELLTNNYFDDGLNNWELHSLDSTRAEYELDTNSVITGKNSVHITVHIPYGDYPSGRIQLNQHNITGGMKSGKDYYISFNLKTNKDMENGFWTIYDEEGSYSWYEYDWIKAKKDVVTHFIYTFRATETDESIYFAIDLASLSNNDVELWIDDIHLIEVEKEEIPINEQELEKVKKLLLDAATGENTNVQYMVTGNSTRDNSYNEMIDYYIEQFRKINVELIDNACSGQSCKDWISGEGGYPTDLSDAIAATIGNGENTIMEFSFGINDSRDLSDVPSFKSRLSNGIGLYLEAKPEATVILAVPVTTGNTALNAILRQTFIELADSLDLLLIDVRVATDGVFGNPAYYEDYTHPNKWGSRRIVNYITDQILPSELYSVMTLTEAPQQEGWMSIDEINAGLDIRLKIDDKDKIKQLLLSAATGENNNVQYMVTGNSTRDNYYNEMIDYYTEQFNKINVELIDNACSGQLCKDWISGEGGYDTDLSDAIAATNGDGENTIMEFSFGLNDWLDINDVQSYKNRLSQGIGLYLEAKPEATVLLAVPVTTDNTERNAVLTQVFEELADSLDLPIVDVTIATKGVFGDPAYYEDGTHPNKWGSRRIVNYITDQILPPELYNVMTLTEAPQEEGWLSIDEINKGLDIRLKKYDLPAGTELLNNNYFDFDLNHWGLNGGWLASLSIDYTGKLEGKNSALVHVNNTSSESWKIQLRQIILSEGIKEGRTYHIQFIAKSDKAVSNIFAVIQQMHDSFNDVYSKEISLEANTQITIVDTFVCKETDELVEWAFNLGTASVSDVDIWFDDVHLIELDEKVSVEEESKMPVEFELSQNYPNPFNPTTEISFAIPVSGNTTLEVYNVLGQKVATLINKELLAGSYKYQFDASNLTSGVYFYKLQSNNKIEVKKMLLLK